MAKCASAATSYVVGSTDTLKNLVVRLTADPDQTLDVMARCGQGVFEIEQIVPWLGAAWGGLFFAPHVLSLAFPALLLPIRTDNLRYGIAHPDMGLSLEVLPRDDVLVVSFTPDNLLLRRGRHHRRDDIIRVRRGERGRTPRLAMAEVLGVGLYGVSDLAVGGIPAVQRIAVDVRAGRAPRALVQVAADRAVSEQDQATGTRCGSVNRAVVPDGSGRRCPGGQPRRRIFERDREP